MSTTWPIRKLAPIDDRESRCCVTSGPVPDDPLAPLAALPRVDAAVGSARAAVDRLLGNRVARRRSNEVSAESALRGAWAGAVLSGVPVELAAIRAGEISDPVLQGALRVSA